MDCAFCCCCFIFIHVTPCVDNNKTNVSTAMTNDFKSISTTRDANSYKFELKKTSQHWISYLNKKHPLSTVNHRTFSLRQFVCTTQTKHGGRPPRYAAAPLLHPRGRRSALCRRSDGNEQFPTFSRRPLQPPDAPTRRWAKRPRDLESGVRVTYMARITSVPILIFLGVSVLDIGPIYATDRHTTDKSIA